MRMGSYSFLSSFDPHRTSGAGAAIDQRAFADGASLKVQDVRHAWGVDLCSLPQEAQVDDFLKVEGALHVHSSAGDRWVQQSWLRPHREDLLVVLCSSHEDRTAQPQHLHKVVHMVLLHLTIW
jgi:hypothetical protein